MAKKLLIKTPLTSDGSNLRYDETRQPMYKATIGELSAKRVLESLNSKLPDHLKHSWTEVEVDDNFVLSSTNEQLKKKLEALEQEDENQKLRDRIAELENKQAHVAKEKVENFLDEKYGDAPVVGTHHTLTGKPAHIDKEADTALSTDKTSNTVNADGVKNTGSETSTAVKEDENTGVTTAADLIASIKEAKTKAEVKSLVGDDERKTVLAAAAKRVDELSGK